MNYDGMQDTLECIFVAYVYMLVWRLLKGKCHSVSDFMYSVMFLWSRKVQSVVIETYVALSQSWNANTYTCLSTYLAFDSAQEAFCVSMSSYKRFYNHHAVVTPENSTGFVFTESLCYHQLFCVSFLQTPQSHFCFCSHHIDVGSR